MRWILDFDRVLECGDGWDDSWDVYGDGDGDEWQPFGDDSGDTYRYSELSGGL
jgi:hypothetical protein